MIQLDEKESQIFDVLASIAQNQKIGVFAIGGYVRDKLLGRPTKDIDIVTDGNGVDLAKRFEEKWKGEKSPLTIYKTYGTAMIKANEIELEFVGARKESYNQNSRNPKVEKGNLKDDQLRRDFTINALAFDLQNISDPEIIDPFNGLEDLEQKIIKCPTDPNQTFSDDPLRMLRAIRFATQLNFTIDEDTFQGIIDNADRLKIITKERIATEINKIMMAEKPSIGWLLLEKSGLLDQILPELKLLKGKEIIDNYGHKDNFYHTLEVLDNITPYTDNLWLRWAALLHDIGKHPTKRFNKKVGWTFHGHEVVGEKMVPKIFKRLKLPLDNRMAYVQKLVRLHLRPISLTNENITDSALRRLLFDADDDIDDLMTLCHADITSKNEYKKARYHENFNLVKAKLLEVEEKDKIRNWQPPIDGDLIQKTFGIKPGRIIGEIKSTIREAILDGDIPNQYEAAYQLMIRIGKEHGLEPVQS